MQVTRNKILGVVGVLFLVLYIISVWWSIEPDPIKPVSAQTDNANKIVGYSTTSSLILTMETLLDKPGGWLSNDVMPPSLMMDNMPAFEFRTCRLS
ncbi:DUF2333 family protein [Shewanella sp. ER-Te-42B-Light]|uniref:DUF2333 family protein n=1 Tax=Shewanella metallivivens TaxID=2872342 RepID=A0ABT5TPM9_9GAMM|nr:DUF2333 family protein [Shewanella metallivivens]MDD8059789.1 DUF2333 family protein [Shewanella metallivivens]